MRATSSSHERGSRNLLLGTPLLPLDSSGDSSSDTSVFSAPKVSRSTYKRKALWHWPEEATREGQ